MNIEFCLSSVNWIRYGFLCENDIVVNSDHVKNLGETMVSKGFPSTIL
jgi:hypothetical protein